MTSEENIEEIFKILSGEITLEDLEFAETLKTVPTKLLLQQYRRLHAYGYLSSMDMTEPPCHDPIGVFKKELATRPHVDNKNESYVKRRKAASAHHGPKKKGGNGARYQHTEWFRIEKDERELFLLEIRGLDYEQKAIFNKRRPEEHHFQFVVSGNRDQLDILTKKFKTLF